ncbi:MAG TPA: FAD-binding oxidoreductase [Vicinamibacterales bacterium]|jgi:FAD/FMN-containing dehydrogenase
MTVTEAVTNLATSFSGQLLDPAHTSYDDARRVHNGLIDKRPALIARCLGTADVVDAVKLARELNMEIAVRGGGHNVAGKATIDGGLMIDLASMKGMLVDPRARTVRAQGGVLWKELNRETQLHALATTGGVVGTTGIAGLTLGGGLGWLMPKYGLALDNLRSAELVMADGSVRRASKDENPDLFWAIRGGGGNFGIATSLEYELHQVGPTITGGLVVHPFARARDVMKVFRDACAKAPDELMLACGLLYAPDGSGQKVAGIVAAHCGSLADGEAAVREIKAYGPPVMDHMGPIPYTVQNSLLDGAFPRGALNYWKAQFLTDLSDSAIDAIVGSFEACQLPLSQIILEHFHGAASRVPVGDTACAMRIEGFNVVIIGQWMEPKDTDGGTAWCRKTHATLEPYFGKMRYMNYLEGDVAGDPGAIAYGPNYARLRKLKSKYDPDNFFHTNVNILPE